MAQSVTLSATSRDILLTLGNTQSLVARTQNRLSSGLKVASPIDDATAFFQAKSLSDRATDFSDRKASIDLAINSLNAALEGIDAIDSLVKQMKGLALSAKSATGTELSTLVTQYNELRTQINNLTTDTSYQGTNLINSSGTVSLKVQFSNLTTSIVTIASVNLRTTSLATTGLGLVVGANFSLVANIDSQIVKLDAAIATLRSNASKLGSNVSLLQTRLDFTKSYVNTLEAGVSNLTLADINEEGANLVALQTRQQLAISSLAFAGQSEQSVLSLFR